MLSVIRSTDGRFTPEAAANVKSWGYTLRDDELPLPKEPTPAPVVTRSEPYVAPWRSDMGNADTPKQSVTEQMILQQMMAAQNQYHQLNAAREAQLRALQNMPSDDPWQFKKLARMLAQRRR